MRLPDKIILAIFAVVVYLLSATSVFAHGYGQGMVGQARHLAARGYQTPVVLEKIAVASGGEGRQVLLFFKSSAVCRAPLKVAQIRRNYQLLTSGCWAMEKDADVVLLYIDVGPKVITLEIPAETFDVTTKPESI
jgi:hypothetical protein